MVVTAVPGITYIQAGVDPTGRTDLAHVPSASINATRASGNGNFINGRGKPDNSGVLLPMPYRPIPGAPAGGAHRGPGELIYVALDPNATTALTTANFGAVELHEEIVNMRTGKNRKRIWALGDRFVTVSQNGIADNATVIHGQRIPILAFPALAPDEYGRLYEFAQIVESS